MGWLRDISEQGNDLTEVEKIQYAQAYILEMIGGYLMPDFSRNLVHLMWLLKLVDFRATGCLSLLQSWARFHFPFLRPRVNHPYTFPLITRLEYLPLLKIYGFY
ncbi:hypothetical protein Goshw_026199 [Gossypium schwendimanii]|uniref:Aminotransferase-like plant mobile domain-containing protein n=1 Tax=Gossypium schwendimanii TaxID=34291 RepID=A0A7J9MWQ0_GOSSC|nr:hypothetical protein [Gossypium schwendimanii]